MTKPPPKVLAYQDLVFTPRFAYGDQCTIAETVSEDFGGELGTGFARMTKAWIPWTLSYDEVITVIEGRLKVHAGGMIHELGPRDSIWLPNGTELIYEAEQALLHYAIHPVKF